MRAWKRYSSLLNMANCGIYVRFLGCIPLRKAFVLARVGIGERHPIHSRDEGS